MARNSIRGFSAEYDKSVFINCPFDATYLPLFRALIFAVFECGLLSRCAQEVYDAGEVRIEQIARIIRASGRSGADFRMNAPHIRVSVVMPGHIGTGIRDNSLKVQTRTDADALNAAQIAQIRARLTSMGWDPSKYSNADIERMHAERARRFITDAPTSAAEAAKIILDGVKADRLRILVGPDAHVIGRMVREDPDHAYEPEFYGRFATEAGWYSGR